MPRTKPRLLEDVIRLIGRAELVTGLHVSDQVLESWLAGNAEMPDRQLLRLADLLVEVAGKAKQRV